VGLCANSLPNSRVNLFDLVDQDYRLLSVAWHLKVPRKGGGMEEKLSSAGANLQDIKGWILLS